MLNSPLLKMLLGGCLCALTATAQITVTALTSAGGFVPGVPANGSLASVFCTGLKGIDGVVYATTYPLPTTLAGVEVKLGGWPVPILAIASYDGKQQINFQVPWENDHPDQVIITQNGDMGWLPTPRLGGWGAFLVDANGDVAAQHANDNSLVTAQNPLHPGEWFILYATNLGYVMNRPETGMPALASPLSPLNFGTGPSAQQFTVEMAVPDANGSFDQSTAGSLTTNYIGMSPGLVGVYQVNARAPAAGFPKSAGRALIYFVRLFPCVLFTPGCQHQREPQASFGAYTYVSASSPADR